MSRYVIASILGAGLLVGTMAETANAHWRGGFFFGGPRWGFGYGYRPYYRSWGYRPYYGYHRHYYRPYHYHYHW